MHASATIAAPPESHPDARLFPLMAREDLRLLAADIAENGLLEPIELCDGMVIDGRNRLRACARAGVAPRFVDVDLAGRRPIEHVLAKNLRRRNLTTVQLALLAYDLIPYYQPAALERRRAGSAGRGGGTRLSEEQKAEVGTTGERVAAIVGISAATVNKLVAIAKADPHVIELMRQGLFPSVRAAAQTAGVTVSFSAASPSTVGAARSFHQPQRDRWDVVMKPLAAYIARWLQQPLSVNPRDARTRLRDLRRIQAGLAKLEKKLEDRAQMRS